MTGAEYQPGGATVGFLAELDGVQAAAVVYLRLWCDGEEGQAQVWHDFAATLGAAHGRKAMRSFEQLFSLCAAHGRRKLVRHSLRCSCLGSDEACFANFIATAAEGAREDALFIATLLVRPDMAPLMVALATDVGLALKRMRLCAPRDVAPVRPDDTTLH